MCLHVCVYDAVHLNINIAEALSPVPMTVWMVLLSGLIKNSKSTYSIVNLSAYVRLSVGIAGSVFRWRVTWSVNCYSGLGQYGLGSVRFLP